MPKHLYLLFFATFLLGAVSGVIFLLITKTGDDAGNTIPRAEGFFVSARMYGGCTRVGCPSYSIEPNGSYTFMESDRAASASLIEGKLHKADREALNSAAAGISFLELKATTFTGTCPVTYDGSAYTFHIVYNGEAYDFDSCRQTIMMEPLFKTLIEYFETLESYSASS